VLHAKVACESRLQELATYHPAPAAPGLGAGPCHQLGVHPRLSTPDPARRIKTARVAQFGAAALQRPRQGHDRGEPFAAKLFAEELRMHTKHLRTFDHCIDQDKHPKG
jgi:hypothetical protein